MFRTLHKLLKLIPILVYKLNLYFILIYNEIMIKLVTLFIITLIYNVSSQPTEAPTPVSWSLRALNSYPNPQSHPKGCGRDVSSWICDPNRMFDLHKIDEIDNQLRSLRDQTVGGCKCGNVTKCEYNGLPFVVAVMRDFQVSSNETEEYLMEIYAKHISTTMSFYTCEDCVVYVISFNNNKLYRFHCNNTMHEFSIACVNYIATETDYHFKNGDYLNGIKKSVQIYKNILKEKSCDLNKYTFKIYIIAIITSITILVVVMCIVYRINRNKRYHSVE